MRFLRSPRVPVLFALPTGLAAADHGREVKLVADATAGVMWNLVYRHFQADGVTVNPSPYKWECIGGGWLYSSAFTGSGVSGTGSSYGDLTGGVGPDVILPLAGDYECDLWANVYNTAATLVNGGVGVTGSAGPTGQPASGVSRVAGTWGSSGYGMAAHSGVLLNMTAGQTARMRYLYTSVATIVYDNRVFRVRPRRVG